MSPTVAGEPLGVDATWAQVRSAAARAVQASYEPHLAALTQRLRRAEAQVDFHRRLQREAMREAMAAGMSAYRVAQVVGVTQRAVHKVRDETTA